MTFNHPSSPPAFASLTKPDLVLLKDVAMVDRLQLTVTRMKEKERELLSEVQLGQYWEQMGKVERWRREFEGEMWADQE